MKFASVFSSFTIAVAFLFTSAAANAQSRLGQAADSLEDSLKTLNKEFEQRGDRFRDSAGSLFRALDKVRSDADRLGKEASQNRPKWQLQPRYQELREHMGDLSKELGRVSLSGDERRAADAVRWNDSLVGSAWKRYDVGVGPSGQDRARRIAVDYLIARYRPSHSAINVESITRRGDDFLVVATLGNRSVHRLAIDPQRERVVSENVTYPNRPTAPPFTEGERARTYATRYLTSKYRVLPRDVDLRKTTDLGRFVRIEARVKGIGDRVLDVDPKTGTVVGDRRG